MTERIHNGTFLENVNRKEDVNMRIENNQVANVAALIERGYNYLSIEEYDNALISFNRALDLDAKGYEAYWGLLLAERQCTKKDGSELIEMGMCIDNDNNYGFAYQYADDNTKNIIQRIAKSCAHMCHVRIIELIAENKKRPAFLRAEKYAMSFFASKQLVDAHTSLLRKNAFTEITNETPKTLLSLLELYANDDVFSLLNQNKHFSKTIESMYTNFMNHLLGEIAADDEYISPEDLKADEDFKKIKKQKMQEHADFYSLTADLTYYKAAMQEAARNYARMKHPHEYDIKYRETLANIWTNPCGDPNNHFIGSDGKPNDIGMRWLYLANQLINIEIFGYNEDYIEMILKFIDNAASNGADPQICQKQKHEFLESQAGKIDNVKVLEILISKTPDCQKARFRIIDLIVHDNDWFSEIDNTFKKDMETANDFLSRPNILKKYNPWYDGKEMLSCANSIEEKAERYKTQFDEKEELINKYSNGIGALNHNDIDSFKESFFKKITYYLSIANKLNELKSKCDEKNRIRLNRNSVIRCILSVIILIGTIIGFIAALNCYRSPEKIIEFSAVRFSIIFISASIVVGLCSSLLSYSCFAKMHFRKNHNLTPTSNWFHNLIFKNDVLLKINFVLTALLSIASTVFLIIGVVKSVAISPNISENAYNVKLHSDLTHICAEIVAAISGLFTINTTIFTFREFNSDPSNWRYKMRYPWFSWTPIIYVASIAYLLIF